MERSLHQEATERFYKYQVRYFKFLAIWRLPDLVTPQERRLYRIRFWVMLAGLCLLLTFFSIRFLGNIGALHEIIKIFFIFATELSCLAKFLTVRVNNDKHARLVRMMHEEAFQPASKAEMESFYLVERTVRTISVGYGALSLVAVHFVLLTQMVVDRAELPLSMYEPCDVSIPQCYLAMYLFQYVAVTLSCYINISYDSISVALLLYVQAQLKMLATRLEKLGWGVPMSNRVIAQQLRSCAIYFERILELKELVEGFVKPAGSVQIFCSVLVLICNFYDMSTKSDGTANMIKTCIYQMVMLQQIFMICYAANEVTLESARLKHAIYKSNWQSWNQSNRKLCLLMMMRFDSPLHVRTINPTYSFSLAAFTSIVNSSYSYFALLKKVNS
ncbi:odorant receptor 46a-like [Scaptodrosophila lebanonensis]|uniref:Odorant receptor n=1 Tax=Drosophila lebanonensis TaxID=7225 RepID=A0A6J2UMF5_DROLE|nr:odorant receptor 46a-like [Scaptodrosophila lebanonensis]